MINKEKAAQVIKARLQLLADRQRAYSEVFAGGPASELIMKDLKRFCRADVSTFDVDPRVHALLEGRREVIQRILDYINLSVDELCEKYHGEKKDHV